MAGRELLTAGGEQLKYLQREVRKGKWNVRFLVRFPGEMSELVWVSQGSSPSLPIPSMDMVLAVRIVRDGNPHHVMYVNNEFYGQNKEAIDEEIKKFPYGLKVLVVEPKHLTSEFLFEQEIR